MFFSAFASCHRFYFAKQFFKYLNGAHPDDPRRSEVLGSGVESVPGHFEVAPLGVGLNIARDLDGAVKSILS